FDDARRNFFDRVARFASNGTFAIERLAKSVDDPAQKSFTNGNLEQLAGGADLLAFANLAPVAQNDGADFGFFQVERAADDVAADLHAHPPNEAGICAETEIQTRTVPPSERGPQTAFDCGIQRRDAFNPRAAANDVELHKPLQLLKDAHIATRSLGKERVESL